MISEQDFHILRQAAQLIYTVLERHQIHQEDAEERRAQFRMFVSERTQDNEKEDRRSKVLKFTKKEIETMPVQYKNLFFTENAVAHIRIKKGNYYEIRCQINGKKITATAKTLDAAKSKFLLKLSIAAGNGEKEIYRKTTRKRFPNGSDSTQKRRYVPRIRYAVAGNNQTPYHQSNNLRRLPFNVSCASIPDLWRARYARDYTNGNSRISKRFNCRRQKSRCA